MIIFSGHDHRFFRRSFFKIGSRKLANTAGNKVIIYRLWPVLWFLWSDIDMYLDSWTWLMTMTMTHDWSCGQRSRHLQFAINIYIYSLFFLCILTNHLYQIYKLKNLRYPEISFRIGTNSYLLHAEHWLFDKFLMFPKELWLSITLVLLV